MSEDRPLEVGSVCSGIQPEDSTLDSSGQGCASSSSARRTPTDGECSPDTGPESRAGTTLFISENQRAEVLLTDYARQLTGGGGKPGQGYPAILQTFRQNLNGQVFESEEFAPIRSGATGANQPLLLTSSAEAPPAKTSASPGDERDFTEDGPGCSLSSPGSPMSLFGPEDGSSLRTYPDYFPATRDATSPSYSRRWPTSGFTISPGECWTADTSECPSGGDGSSSLPDVLLDEVPARFFLSPRAAAGILRRAEKRGRDLPRALHLALTALASTNQDDAKRMTTTSSSTPSTNGEAEPTITRPRQDSSSLARSSAPTLTASTQSQEVTRQVDAVREATGSVRRLTVIECLRLQGFPDDWLWPLTDSPTDPAIQPAVTP